MKAVELSEGLWFGVDDTPGGDAKQQICSSTFIEYFYVNVFDLSAFIMLVPTYPRMKLEYIAC